MPTLPWEYLELLWSQARARRIERGQRETPGDLQQVLRRSTHCKGRTANSKLYRATIASDSLLPGGSYNGIPVDPEPKVDSEGSLFVISVKTCKRAVTDRPSLAIRLRKSAGVRVFAGPHETDV